MLLYFLFVSTVIYLLDKAYKIQELTIGDGLLSPMEIELDENDETVKRILE